MFIKKINTIIVIITTLTFGTGCNEEILNESFYPEDKFTIADYLNAYRDSSGLYYQLVDELGLLQSLSAYNPYGNSYTLFLPNDEAFSKYFESNANYKNIQELISDHDYAKQLAKYHIVNSGLETNDFPFGSLADTTATGDYLTVSIDTSSMLPLINGEAHILTPNIELINGYIHVIDKVMVPITFSISEWLEERPQFSMMNEIFEKTTLLDTLNSDKKYTLFLESNEILINSGYSNAEEIIADISPTRSDYNSPDNELFKFAAYHILEGIFYLDDFEGNTTNYNTKTLYPALINGESLELKINPGVENFDTIVNTAADTTIIDYVSINYEQSNNQASNGAIHLIKNMMMLYLPGRSQVINQFYNEPAINDIRNESGKTEFFDSDLFEVLKWSGSENMIYLKSDEQINGIWGNDYIILEGSFTMTYTVPKLLPGKYNFFMNAHALSDFNASINISLDGNPLGGNLDLTSGGTSSNPFYNFLIGRVNLEQYAEHTITISSVIPGIFRCDRFTFQPVD